MHVSSKCTKAKIASLGPPRAYQSPLLDLYTHQKTHLYAPGSRTSIRRLALGHTNPTTQIDRSRVQSAEVANSCRATEHSAL